MINDDNCYQLWIFCYRHRPSLCLASFGSAGKSLARSPSAAQKVLLYQCLREFLYSPWVPNEASALRVPTESALQMPVLRLPFEMDLRCLQTRAQTASGQHSALHRYRQELKDLYLSSIYCSSGGWSHWTSEISRHGILLHDVIIRIMMLRL